MCGEIPGRRVAVLVEKDFEDLELLYPLLRLREAAAEVAVVGPEARTYASKHGYEVKADLAIEQVRPEDFDAVVIPGGWAPDYLRRSRAVCGFVRRMRELGKVVAGICHAGHVLVSAGILRGRTVTCVAAIRDDVVNAGATYVDREVVVDDKLVTSRTPADLPAFCKAIIEALS